MPLLLALSAFAHAASVPSGYTSIQRALDASEPVIVVDAAAYAEPYEALTVYAPVAISAINGRVAIGSLTASSVASVELTGLDVLPPLGERGLYVTYGVLVLDDVTVTGGSADLGGNLYAAAADVVCDACTLQGGSAGYGGDVYLSYSTFDGDDAQLLDGVATGHGGAIYAYRSDLTLSGGLLSGNEGYFGGAIYHATDDASANSATLDGVELTDNVGVSGGALYAGAHTGLTLTENRFTANTAEQGGAVYYEIRDPHYFGWPAAVFGNDFLDNTATDGGALWLTGLGSGALVTIAWNRFCGNMADTGGAVGHDGAGVTLNNNYYAYNAATLSGGAIAAAGDTLTTRNETFVHNTAPSGAGVWTDDGETEVYSALLLGSAGPAIEAKNKGNTLIKSPLLWSNTADILGPNTAVDLVLADPLLSWSDDGDCTNDAYTLLPGSPAIDAGWTPFYLVEEDGTDADIGAKGGPEDAGYNAGMTNDRDKDGSEGRYDCDDHDAALSPLTVEVCDGDDDDCDLQIDESSGIDLYFDVDADGHGAGDPSQACGLPAGWVAAGDDCDDADELNFPGNAEVCDAADNDCDAVADDGALLSWYVDVDGDGHGAGPLVEGCVLPVDGVASADDCDDADELNFPGNAEVCDAADNDCDAAVDDGVLLGWYVDVDGDGYGAGAWVEGCALPADGVASADDCDDADAGSHPGAAEIADNAVDEDCDGVAQVTPDDTDPPDTDLPDDTDPPAETVADPKGGCDHAPGAPGALLGLALALITRRRSLR